MRAGVPIVCWLASLAVVACTTVEVTQHYAPDQPVKRRVARQPDSAASTSAAQTPPPSSSPEPRYQGLRSSPSRGLTPSAPSHAPHDNLHLARAFGLVSTPLASNAAVQHWCEQIVPHAREVSMPDCLTGGFQDSGHRSVQGRALVMHRQLATRSSARGRILLIGATHGDEPSTIGMGFDWMARIRAHGTAYDWYWIPVLNPDGVTSSPETRVNADGIDLNRNLPTEDWKVRSAAYWKRVGYEKRRFPGKTAASEPENQWLVNVIAAVQPDIIITLHAPYGLLDYDGNFPPPQTIGNLRLHRLGVYPGSLGNFGFHQHGIPVMTLELEDAQTPPAQGDADRMWRDINAWLADYVSSTHQLRTATDSSASAG